MSKGTFPMQPLHDAGRTELAGCWAGWSVQHRIADSLAMPLYVGLLIQ